MPDEMGDQGLSAPAGRSAPLYSHLGESVCVAIALGLGTMVGWKRIVVTVGEKIGKAHLTYGPGRIRRTGGGRHHSGRRLVRRAGVHHAHAVQRHCRHHGGQWVRPAMEHGALHRAGLGHHPAGGDGCCRAGSTLSCASSSSEERCGARTYEHVRWTCESDERAELGRGCKANKTASRPERGGLPVFRPCGLDAPDERCASPGAGRTGGQGSAAPAERDGGRGFFFQ